MSRRSKLAFVTGVTVFMLAVNILPVFTAHVIAADDFDTKTKALENLTSVADTAGLGGNTDIKKTIGNVIKILLTLLGVLMVLLLIYGGFVWMTAMGEAQKVEKAKGIIKTAIIGVIVLLMAYAIAFFILSDVWEAVKNPNGVPGQQN